MTWTVRHFAEAKAVAAFEHDLPALSVLDKHHPYADHCLGYEVLAWPCAPAARVLDRLLQPSGISYPPEVGEQP